MLLREIRLTNVKCFAKDTIIDFTVGKKPDEPPHRWVVVYGNNGLGKSTLLRAIAVALTGEPGINFLLPTAEGWVRGDQRTASITVELSRNEAGKGEGDVISGQRKKPLTVSWTLVGKRSTLVNRRPAAAGSIHLEESDDYRLFQSYVATDEEQRGWLVCGYGPHRRLMGGSSDITDKVPPEGRAARLLTLFHEKAALSSAEHWLIELDHKARVSGDSSRLDAVRKLLDEALLHGGVTLGDVRPDRVVFKTPFSQEVAMTDLSDGYRTMLALALDLLRRISFCFDLKKLLKEEDGRVVVPAEGVVLIDEIDSHLHPEWQRIIGGWLHRTFPRLQFVVTTHSPLIPGRVSTEDGLVVRLEAKTQGKGKVVGAVCVRSTEQALTADQNLTSPNFGLRSSRDVLVEDLVAQIRDLTARVRAGSATPAERRKLLERQHELDETAPPVLGVGADEAG